MSSPNIYNRDAIKQLLPEDVRLYLSADAIRIYEKVWHLITKKGGRFCLLSDGYLSRATELSICRLPAAREQLAYVGLIKFEYGIQPKDTPEDVRHRYTFIADRQTH